MLLDSTTLDEHFSAYQPEPGAVRAALGPRIRQARLERLHGENLEIFGRRIAEYMERKRAFSNVTISNWETGRQEPSFEALVAIAKLTCLPLRYFAGVGELSDYPSIDWLDREHQGDSPALASLLATSSRLPEHKRLLLEAQLKSLIDDLYRLWPSRAGGQPSGV
jgi:transcriptional regulator with XRE-family HTH domain